MNLETKTVAKINNVEIVIVKNGKNLVPIKPICEALGIDFSRQLKKLKEDPFLCSTMGVTPTVGMDKKEREMVCIELQFVFGWLFTINPKNVKPEAEEQVSKFRFECYNALFSNFVESPEFLQFKQTKMRETHEEIREARKDYAEANKRIKEKEKQFREYSDMTIEEWRSVKSQLSLEFSESV